MAGSPVDGFERSLGARTCGVCGAKAREDRVRCLRCGADLRAASASGEGWADRRSRFVLFAGVGSVVVLGTVLGGVLLRRSSDSSASPPAVSPAVSAPLQTAARPVPAVPSAARLSVPATPAESARLGAALYDKGNVAGSVAHFQAVVDAEPDNTEALNNLGQVLVRTGRPADAVQYFNRAIVLAGGTWAYQFNRARAYAMTGDWRRAAAGYQDALALFPDDYATQFNLAKALEASGDLPGAIAGYERAIALAPGQADFHLSHGRALEAGRRMPEAMAAYTRFLDLAPNAPEADKVRAYRDQLKAQP